MKSLFIALFMLPLGLLAQSKKDTLVVPKNIKVIIIDGESYDIVRTTEIKKAEPIFRFPGTGTITVDSSVWRRPSLQFYNGFQTPLYNSQNNKP